MKRTLFFIIISLGFSPEFAPVYALPQPSAWYDALTLPLDQGLPVDTWLDSSGHGIHLTTRNQGKNGSITYSSAVPALNDKPAVHLPGIFPEHAGSAHATYLRADPDKVLRGTAYTIFAVTDVWQGAGDINIVNILDNSAPDGYPEGGVPVTYCDIDDTVTQQISILCRLPDKACAFLNTHEDNRRVHEWKNVGTTNIFEAEFSNETFAQIKAYLNGEKCSDQQRRGKPNQLLDINRGVLLAAPYLYWMNNAAASGYLAEVLIYNRQLNEAERQEVGRYLQDKYAVNGVYVPEPSSLVLPALTLIGLSCRRRYVLA